MHGREMFTGSRTYKHVHVLCHVVVGSKFLW